ncbi:MAG TPA: hypothetical protein VMW27_04945 [Thermoanaerobaculia bacterium]|nr:hypothetical protein [Thermoanaerobaculia bacterium]
MKKLFRTVAVCLLPLALGGAAPSAVTPPPGLPEGVEPLPPEMHSRMDELVHTAEERRGLRLKRPVAWGWLGPDALREKITAELRKELPAETLRPFESALKAFGLVPERLDVVGVYTDLLTAEIAGFYDPDAEYMALVRRGQSKLDALDEMTLVHEAVHAIQDQHFDLGAFVDLDPMSDAASAREALVEGDATWAMLERVADISPKILEESSRLEGGLSKAPVWFRETLLFSYFRGLAFCHEVRALGGQALVDRAFTVDPPRSTEQILHPEKWAQQRDDPVAITSPDLSAVLPGHAKAAEGELGEMGIRILLTGEDQSGRKTAETAAAGWGGDRFQVYEKDGRRVLAWATEWDTEADAAEFETAARGLGADWDVRRAGPKRVQVVRGVEGEALAVVQGALTPIAEPNPPAAPSLTASPSAARY